METTLTQEQTTTEVITPEVVERTTAWHAIGRNFNTHSIDEALELAGLNWDVEKHPLQTVIDGTTAEVPGYFANVTSNGDVVGVVSDSYEICQNRDAFQFAGHVSKDLRFVRGGMTSRGLVYMIGELPTYRILGDEFTPHLIFQNSFNTFCGVRVAIIPLRIVCQNQFNFAWKHSENTLGFKHSSGLIGNMERGAETYKNMIEYLDDFQQGAELLAAEKIDDVQTGRFLDKFFEIKEDMTERQRNAISEKRDRFMQIYNRGDNANFKGTIWGMVNAYSDYLTHPAKVKSEESRFTNSLIDRSKFKGFMDVLSGVVS